MNYERLLNVAKALRESPNPDKFHMGEYAINCNTPACAFGHYAARKDLQDAFELHAMCDDGCCVGVTRVTDPTHSPITYDFNVVLAHFAIEREDARLLFGPDGCGGAETAIEAAENIESFVRQNRAWESEP